MYSHFFSRTLLSIARWLPARVHEVAAATLADDVGVVHRRADGTRFCGSTVLQRFFLSQLLDFVSWERRSALFPVIGFRYRHCGKSSKKDEK